MQQHRLNMKRDKSWPNSVGNYCKGYTHTRARAVCTIMPIFSETSEKITDSNKK
jgi:hypothetical protein